MASGEVKPLILYEDEYAFILENDSGVISLVEGPQRFILAPNQTLSGNKKKKITLKENEFVVVKNPYTYDSKDKDKSKKSCQMGTREVRIGPLVFPMYPGEELDGGIQNSYVLKPNEAIIVQALDTHESEDTHVKRLAGEKWVIKGPANFIPNKFERVLKQMEAINISQNKAIYVRNNATSELKLVVGPSSYMLNHDEELFQRELTPDQYKALELDPVPSHFAPVINIQKNEIICVEDYKNNTERYIIGPQIHLLGPYEGVKVITLSGDVPKREGVQKAARIRFSPDFMIDQFIVRTHDNAQLNLTVSYKWRFIIDEDNLDTLFSGDFIGYACQSMRSRIREAASAHDFEEFHTTSAQILRNRLFKEYKLKQKIGGETTEVKVKGRYFPENSFLIFELDIKEVTPTDPTISDLLSESIKANMKILCRKSEDSAQFQSEKERIESEAEIARLKRNLIEIEIANFTKETIEKAKIEKDALIEKAKAEKEAEEIIEKAKIEAELQRMKSTMQLLSGNEGSRYLEFARVSNLGKNVTQATIIPHETKTLFLPAPTPSSTNKAIERETKPIIEENVEEDGSTN